MATTKLLYAWATPAFAPGAPVDHTWVTSYDNRANAYPNLAAVVNAKEDYWYCWGSFHSRGQTPALPDGSLGSKSGDVMLARCLVTSNADSATTFAARGTIFTYGVDGVCHQLANQVLYASGAGGSQALTAIGANGYGVSSAIYGTYGLQHAAWRNKVATCGNATARPSPTGGASGKRRARQPMGPGPNMIANVPTDMPDEFEQRVGQVLGGKNLAAATQLLSLRAQFQITAAARAHTMAVSTAAELNARNRQFLDDAAKLLSASDFKAIFGVDPGENVNLVLDDPTK